MSQQDNFASGFITGALLGGVVGGVIGALAASRLSSSGGRESSRLRFRDEEDFIDAADDLTEESMEQARRGLEDKIAQLNEAIDDVRQQMGGTNGYPQRQVENSSMMDS